MTRAKVAGLAEVTRKVINGGYTGAVAAGFLRGANPELDDRAAFMLIRDATAAELPAVMVEVRGAVRALLDR